MQINTLETKFAKCSSIEIPDSYYNRMTTGCPEIDLMFGTEHLMGFMAGSAIAMTGTPGAGKSTFTLLVSQMLATQGKRAAIASGEESHLQIAYACKRLGVTDVDVAHIKNVEEIAEAMHHYDFMVVDSFQALRSNKNMKKREFYQYAQDLLLSTAKETGCVLVFVLHITTQGLPKGGTDIIHAVDVNMKVTVDKEDDSMRLFHVYKNRFGETKIHMAMMTSKGFDFKGAYVAPVEAEKPKKDKTPTAEIRKEEILNMDEPSHLTMDRVCDRLGVAGHTAGILLRELVGEGKMQKYGRGVNAVWKIAQECQKLHKHLTK
jgi:predicted ATP-dependent serine protease